MSTLGVETFGTGKPNLVLLHGFSQTGESWRLLANRFAAYHQVSLVDLPGHGTTTARPANLDEAGRLIADASTDSVIIGYSMGARIALHAGLQQDQRLKGLVLIGAHPGILDDAERRNRRETDEELASRIGEIGVEKFIEEWLNQPMFAGVRDLDHQDRLRNSSDGLAYALRTLGTGNQRVLDTELAGLTLPVLVLAGDRDLKFLALTERFRHCLKSVTIDTIPNSGHACHLEQPDATCKTIDAWLENLRDSNSHR